MSIRVGFVTGLAKESRCLGGGLQQRHGMPAIECAGARPEAAANAARRLLTDSRCGALVSFGLAGGLCSDLDPGTIIVADRVIDESGRVHPTDPLWCRQIAEHLASHVRLRVGTIAGRGTPVLTGEDKKALRLSTDALAVDMESAAVAAVAVAAAVPFIVVRAIADPSNRTVPVWLPTTIDPNGEPMLGRVLAGCFRHPGDMPALVRLGGDSAAAFSALRRVALNGVPLFQLRR